jgi:hypothetical protein
MPNVIWNVPQRENKKLYDIIQITGTVKNTVNLDGFTTNDVEYEVRFNNEDAIT